MTTPEKSVEEIVKTKLKELIDEYHDGLIDIAITNKHLRGCVTSNQLIEYKKQYFASTHKALTQLNNK